MLVSVTIAKYSPKPEAFCTLVRSWAGTPLWSLVARLRCATKVAKTFCQDSLGRETSPCIFSYSDEGFTGPSHAAR